MAFLNEIATKLAALGVGTVGSTLYIGILPETPDACTSIFEYGGLGPDFKIGTTGIDFETPAVQVICRGVAWDYATPRANISTAYTGLAAVEAATLTSSSGGTSAFYHWIHPQQSPFIMERDANNRVLFACNFLCEKDLST